MKMTFKKGFKNMKVAMVFIFVFIYSVVNLNIIKAQGIENGNYYLPADYDYMVRDALARFPNEARDYKLFLCDYEPFCDYLNYGKNKNILFNFKGIKFDENGIPKVLYGNSYYYNPVTLAQYALSLYGEYLEGKNKKDEFIKVTDKLLTLQDARGAFLYNFPWLYYLNGKPYNSGWVSGMAQGQALSVLSRAYKITGDEKYLKSGEKALNFLITPVSKGGVTASLGSLNSSLRDNVIFEEYISSPPTYTLNGFMFAVLGLYDWANVSEDIESKKIAENYFNKGIDSLTKILGYYDIGGFTAYDLGYLTRSGLKPHIGVNYHGVHIYLLKALNSITNDKIINNYYELWKSYIENGQENRISGSNRYETNANISKEMFKENADTVVLANGENYADALSAAPLANKNKAPLLLTASNILNSYTKNEIKRLNPKKIIIIGGVGSVSQGICNEIKNTIGSVEFERIGGIDRYETSSLIAEKLDSKEAFVVYGQDYADAVSIASIAASKSSPILLTRKDKLPSPIKKYIDNNKELSSFYIIGEKGVIADTVKNEISNSQRIGGKNRYDTNINILNKFKDYIDFKTAYATVGGPGSKDFADALSCATLAANGKSSVLLIPANAAVENTTKIFARDNFHNTKLIAIGGEKVLPNYKISLINFQSHLNDSSN